MSYGFDAASYRHEGVTVRRIWLTVALSLLVHVAALLWLPRIRPLAPGSRGAEPPAERLQVELAALSRSPPVSTPGSSPESAAIPNPPVRQPRARPRTRPPPVLVAPAPLAPEMAAPALLPPPPAAPIPEPPASRPPEEDLASYIQARRRERGEQQGFPGAGRMPIANDQLAANLPRPGTGVAARNRQGSGGLFEIRRMSYDDAAFDFFGWNDAMGRQTPQLVEVRLGNNSDMRIAVVRKMIAIIREHTKDDFVWRSAHRENSVTLSARPSDNAVLEDFLLHDLFDDPPQAPQSGPAR